MQLKSFIFVDTKQQTLHCFQNDVLYASYAVSTAKNGLGEQAGSECTPRGWHKVYAKIGLECEINSVFVARQWTGELYNEQLKAAHPNRDWILTRIIQLEGLEPGRNKGGEVDSLSRYIYIHGIPDSISLENPGSHGCIRMRNQDVIALADWVMIDTPICIE